MMWLLSDQAAMVSVTIIVIGLFYLRPRDSAVMKYLFRMAIIGLAVALWFYLFPGESSP